MEYFHGWRRNLLVYKPLHDSPTDSPQHHNFLCSSGLQLVPRSAIYVSHLGTVLFNPQHLSFAMKPETPKSKKLLPRGITLNQRNGRFIAWGSKEGKQVWLGDFESLAQAQEVRATFQREKELNAAVANSYGQRFALFIAHLEQQGLSPMTVNIYRTYGRKLEAFFGPRIPISSINTIHARNFIIQQKENGVSDYTIREYTLRYCRSIFRWFEKSGFTINNPFAGIKLPKVADPEQSYFTQEEIQKVIQYLEGKSSKARSKLRKSRYAYHIAIIKFLFSSGIRKQELLKLRQQDVDLVGRKVRIVGKTEGANYAVNLSTVALDALRTLLASASNDYVIPGGTDYLNRASRISRIFSHLNSCLRNSNVLPLNGRHFNAYSLRHSLCMHLIGKGLPIEEVSKVMRHSSIKTTMGYYHLSSEKRAQILDKAIDL